MPLQIGQKAPAINLPDTEKQRVTLEQFKGNKFSFAANASAVAVKSGAAAAAKFENGVAVFTRPVGGAMFEAGRRG